MKTSKIINLFLFFFNFNFNFYQMDSTCSNVGWTIIIISRLLNAIGLIVICIGLVTAETCKKNQTEDKDGNCIDNQTGNKTKPYPNKKIIYPGIGMCMLASIMNVLLFAFTYKGEKGKIYFLFLLFLLIILGNMISILVLYYMRTSQNIIGYLLVPYVILSLVGTIMLSRLTGNNNCLDDDKKFKRTDEVLSSLDDNYDDL